MTIQVLSTDVLVIGGGLAGVRASLEARIRGADVVLASKGPIGFSGNSTASTGGFAAPISPEDSCADFEKDTIEGGFNINDRELVNLVCSGSREALFDLSEMGFDFGLNSEAIGPEAVPGHRHPRSIRYLGGGTWHLMRMVPNLLDVAGISLFQKHFVVDLVRTGPRIIGALLWDSEQRALTFYHAAAVVLAAGGCGGLYSITTNKPDVTGDGYALALRAGCALRDMEFIQFTPTAFAYPEGLRGMTLGGVFLAQPGVRLLNIQGERFMKRYAPDRMENAIRSIVVRAIHRETSEGRGTANGGVFLDLTSLSPRTIERLKPGLIQLCLENGVDPRREPIETAPSAHHCIGGVAAGASLSPLKGLYVAGEVLGGTHGANRLSSNSLTEANVTGKLAGKMAADFALAHPASANPPNPASLPNPLPKSGQAKIGSAEKLREIMASAGGVERTEVQLANAESSVAAMHSEHLESGSGGVDDVQEWMERLNMLTVAAAIIRAARIRRESRGAHQRIDFPQRNDAAWLGNTFIRLGADGLKSDFKPL